MKPLSRLALLLALAASSIPGCSDDEPSPTTSPATTAPPVSPLALPEGCQPLLGGRDCFLPYPSDHFLKDDATMPSGKRFVATGAGKLTNDKGKDADVSGWLPIDGASKTPTILTLLGGPVSAEGLVGLLDPPERSATLDSPTLILEADTGKLIPHFVDVDIREPRPDHQALVLSPLVGLKARTRYLVAIRKIRTPEGALAATPEGFARLRDRANDASLAPLQQRYEQQVFAPLTGAGVAREELQLAWDFTTGSDEHTARDMLRVRELTLAWLADHKPSVSVESVDDKQDDPHIWRTVRGTITVPLFLTSDAPGATLQRGADGQVAQNGEAQVPFVARIPNSVRDRFAPGRPLGFGHGFFGSREEVVSDTCSAMADRLAMMFVGIDWWGMSGADLSLVLDALVQRPAEALAFTDRVHQSMASWTVVTAAMRLSFASLDAFKRPADGAPGAVKNESGESNAGQPVFDPSRVYFLGISQGHILGGTQAAFNPDLDRIALNVGGASLTQMMFRAKPFNGFLAILQGGVKTPFDQRKYTATMQPLFDRVDPGFWASRVLADKLPGSPADRRVLQQAGIGDVEVPNLGSFLHARLLGLPLLSPSPLPVFGLTPTPGPIDGSAFSLFDMGVSPDVYALPKAATKENPVHNGLRLQPPVLDQLDAFFRPDSTIIAPSP